MTPAAQAETYARQALRFAKLAGVTGKLFGRECYWARGAGRYEALRDIRLGSWDVGAAAREARKFAVEAARAVRELRQWERKHGRNTAPADVLQERAANAAAEANRCAGRAECIEMEMRP